MIIGVDHILIAVGNLEPAMEAYRRLGFQVMRGGEHPRMGTHNALVPLSDGAYLELIGVRNYELARQFPNTRLVADALKRPERLATFALDTNDIDADLAGMRNRGLGMGDPAEGERRRPDGKRVVWLTAHPADPDLPFLIEDVTPRPERVPLPTEGLGARAFVAELQVATRSLPDASRIWKNFLGKIPPDDYEFILERSAVRLIGVEGRPTGLHSVTLGVDDLQGLAQDYRERGIHFKQSEARLELDQVDTAGAWLNLIQK
ncbi:MAG: VOC family protein [Rudaea sp.]